MEFDVALNSSHSRHGSQCRYMVGPTCWKRKPYRHSVRHSHFTANYVKQYEPRSAAAPPKRLTRNLSWRNAFVDVIVE